MLWVCVRVYILESYCESEYFNRINRKKEEIVVNYIVIHIKHCSTFQCKFGNFLSSLNLHENQIVHIFKYSIV